MSEYKGPDLKFLIGFFLGGVIGAITIFLIGTKEGKKTTKILEEKGKDFIEDLQDKIDDIEQQGKALIRKGEALKEQVTEQIEEQKETITKETAVRVDKALAHIEEVQEQGLETTATLRKRLFKNIPKR